MTQKIRLHAAFSLFLISALSACSGDSESTASDQVVCNDLGASSVDEGFVGDFSDNPSSPTIWSLGAGANELIAGTSTGDLDYVSFTVGNCDTLDSVTVNAFSETGGDVVAFVAIQQGATFTVTPDSANDRLDELFGYRHIGPADINQDILAEMGRASGAAGFTSPLPAGTYTLWLNQLGSLSEYTLGFNVSRVQ